MIFTELVFYGFSLIMIVAALGVITSRNPVHSVLFLVLNFLCHRCNLDITGSRVPGHYPGIGLCRCRDGAVPVCGHDAGY